MSCNSIRTVNFNLVIYQTETEEEGAVMSRCIANLSRQHIFFHGYKISQHRKKRRINRCKIAGNCCLLRLLSGQKIV
jgi:hypothetical protein